MNKQLKKTIEAELAALINSVLSVRNKKAAADISKHIKEGVKNLAKKFVKHIPKPATSGKTKKAGSSKVSAKKPKSKKVKTAKKKVPSKTAKKPVTKKVKPAGKKSAK